MPTTGCFVCLQDRNPFIYWSISRCIDVDRELHQPYCIRITTYALKPTSDIRIVSVVTKLTVTHACMDAL